MRETRYRDVFLMREQESLGHLVLHHGTLTLEARKWLLEIPAKYGEIKGHAHKVTLEIEERICKI